MKRMLNVVLVLILIPFFHSCEEKKLDPDYPMSEADQALVRLTDDFKNLPYGNQLADEISNPGSAIKGECHYQEEQAAQQDDPKNNGKYTITSQAQRKALIEKIIAAGPNKMSTTKMTMPDGTKYEVMNDNVKLPDGTYVPLTFPEAKRIAQAWGWQLPDAGQAKTIGRAAASDGNQYKAITRTPNNGEASQLKSMNEMMNDSRMRERSKAGDKKLIDGHFKWYTNDGRIYGFAKGDGTFWQNSPSAAHVGDPGYYDYSHGVRLIRKVQ
ncbi:MAG: hypothetical protein EP326_03035 [Deltaproteobacteria bacterium]|nr:MAG: hypothetical protein EP326_03035 [Deltaproteobacteria bacterium]TNF30308.1 MAG: hypothetical protein EP319_05540 [Deltaproteobacteria bacterium]